MRLRVLPHLPICHFPSEHPFGKPSISQNVRRKSNFCYVFAYNCFHRWATRHCLCEYNDTEFTLLIFLSGVSCSHMRKTDCTSPLRYAQIDWRGEMLPVLNLDNQYYFLVFNSINKKILFYFDIIKWSLIFLQTLFIFVSARSTDILLSCRT